MEAWTGAKVRHPDCALKRRPDFFLVLGRPNIQHKEVGIVQQTLFTLSLFTVHSLIVHSQKWSLCHLSFVSLSISGCEIKAKYIILNIIILSRKTCGFSLMTLMTNDIMTRPPLLWSKVLPFRHTNATSHFRCSLPHCSLFTEKLFTPSLFTVH